MPQSYPRSMAISTKTDNVLYRSRLEKLNSLSDQWSGCFSNPLLSAEVVGGDAGVSGGGGVGGVGVGDIEEV